MDASKIQSKSRFPCSVKICVALAAFCFRRCCVNNQSYEQLLHENLT